MMAVVRERMPNVVNQTVSKIWNIFCAIALVFVVLVAVALVGVRIVGLRPFVVLSGSMEPSYHVGSLIYVKSVDPRELKVGDPITFMLNEDTVATHRIVEVLEDEADPDTLRFITKGDANEKNDASSVHHKNIIGRPVFSLPYLGYVAGYIRQPPGLYAALGLGALLLVLAFWPGKKKKENSPQTTG